MSIHPVIYPVDCLVGLLSSCTVRNRQVVIANILDARSWFCKKGLSGMFVVILYHRSLFYLRFVFQNIIFSKLLKYVSWYFVILVTRHVLFVICRTKSNHKIISFVQVLSVLRNIVLFWLQSSPFFYFWVSLLFVNHWHHVIHNQLSVEWLTKRQIEQFAENWYLIQEPE